MENNNLCSVRNPLIHIVLDRPCIAANIAAIVRLATATNSVLHVCGPLVFDNADKTKWRAGLDYFAGARVHFHKDVFRCLKLLDRKPYLIEVGGAKAPWELTIQSGDVFVFGPENGSIRSELMGRYSDRIVTLPQFGPVRSLNLSQVAAIVTFNAVQQYQISLQSH